MRRLNVRSDSEQKVRSSQSKQMDPKERLDLIGNLIAEIVVAGPSDVDAIGDLNVIQGMITAPLKNGKDELKSQCKEKSLKAMIGSRYTMTIQKSSDWDVNPVNLVKWLKDHAKMDLFPSLLKAKITEIKQYLGAAMLGEIGTENVNEYGSCRFKAKE
jgi:hypothetical protein